MTYTNKKKNNIKIKIKAKEIVRQKLAAIGELNWFWLKTWDPYIVTFNTIHVLLDFSLTVKAATLIFIYGRGSAISSAKEGKSGSISIIW